jgi:hypothetical protein
MSKILYDKDGIILKKKDNTFKLEVCKNVKLSCDIIKIIENLEIYELLRLLNEKIILKSKIIKDNENTDVLMCLNNFLKTENESEDSDSPDYNYYISFTNNINKISNNKIIMTGNKNDIIIDKENWKKIEIDNVIFDVELLGTNLNICFKFSYVGKKIPIYTENAIGLIFKKIISNLICYYTK